MRFLLFGDVAFNFEYTLLVEWDKPREYPGLCIGNLETPILLTGGEPRLKAGPNLSGYSQNFGTFRESFSHLLLNLANNHMMDYGLIGLQSTLALCKQHGVITIGASTTLELARSTHLIELDGVRVGVLGRCETQFGIAEQDRAGVAPLDATIYHSIAQIRREVDIVIISIHGAAEMSPWPSPKWQDRLRSFIDAGADIVHGHHAHVPQGFEVYKNGFICYGLGNFPVNPSLWLSHANTLWSLAIDLDVYKDQTDYACEILVVELIEGRVLVRTGPRNEYTQYNIYLDQCNKPLQDRQLLAGLWQEFAIRAYNLYFAKWLGFQSPSRSVYQSNKDCLYASVRQVRRFLQRRSKDTPPAVPDQSQYLLWYHLFACESHQDAITTALGVLGGELKDLRTVETCRLADEMMPWSVQADNL